MAVLVSYSIRCDCCQEVAIIQDLDKSVARDNARILGWVAERLAAAGFADYCEHCKPGSVGCSAQREHCHARQQVPVSSEGIRGSG